MEVEAKVVSERVEVAPVSVEEAEKAWDISAVLEATFPLHSTLKIVVPVAPPPWEAIISYSVRAWFGMSGRFILSLV